jgi:hypothetical protein
VEGMRATYHEVFVDVSNVAYWDQVGSVKYLSTKVHGLLFIATLYKDISIICLHVIHVLNHILLRR